MRNRCLKAPQGYGPAQTRWIRAGVRCVPVRAGGGRGTPGLDKRGWPGGCGEGLRRSRGDAAGAKPGTSPADRLCGERGNRPGDFRLPGPARAGQREGAPSASGPGAGRRARSSPGAGKPRTWRRGPAGSCMPGLSGQEALVNTGGPSAGLYEAERRVLLMVLIRTGRSTRAGGAGAEPRYQPAPPPAQEAPLELSAAPGLEQTVRAQYEAGHSQRAIARELDIDRRKVKRILDPAA